MKFGQRLAAHISKAAELKKVSDTINHTLFSINSVITDERDRMTPESLGMLGSVSTRLLQLQRQLGAGQVDDMSWQVDWSV